MTDKFYRHGDVFLRKVEELPDRVELVEDKNSEYILAHGEITGHKHLLTMDRPTEQKVKVLKDPRNGKYYLVLEGQATVTHEEHKAITVAPGLYEIDREREHDYFAVRNREVLD